MSVRILRGVRVATQEGIQPASVHIKAGKIAAIAGYDEVPRLARPEELGKSLLMPGIVHFLGGERSAADSRHAAAGGITTLLTLEKAPPGFVDEALADDAAASEGIDIALQRYLAQVWTRARDRGESLESLVLRISVLPAQRAGLGVRKGKIALDHDADLVIWNPELTVVNSSPLLYGAIRQTILRGHTIFKDGQLVGEPRGQHVPGY